MTKDNLYPSQPISQASSTPPGSRPSTPWAAEYVSLTQLRTRLGQHTSRHQRTNPIIPRDRPIQYTAHPNSKQNNVIEDGYLDGVHVNNGPGGTFINSEHGEPYYRPNTPLPGDHSYNPFEYDNMEDIPQQQVASESTGRELSVFAGSPGPGASFDEQDTSPDTTSAVQSVDLNTGVAQGTGLDVSVVEGLVPNPLTYRLSVAESQLADKVAQMDERVSKHQELKSELKEAKQELKELKQECKEVKQERKDMKKEYEDIIKDLKKDYEDAKQECKSMKLECKSLHDQYEVLKQQYEGLLKAAQQEYDDNLKSMKQQCKDANEQLQVDQEQMKQEEHQQLSDELRSAKEQLRTSNDDRRLLQAQCLVLQNEILLLQGDMRVVLRNPGMQPPSRGGQTTEQGPAYSTPNTTAAKPVAENTSTGKKSTPKAHISAADDIDTTPTPSKATLARIDESSPTPGGGGTYPAIVSSSAAKKPTTSSNTPSSSSLHQQQQASTTFGPPSFGPYGPPPSAHGSNSGLRERASFYPPMMNRFDDPFQQSPPHTFQNQPSRQTSMVSLSGESSHPSSSAENMQHGTPSKSGGRRHQNRSSKALVSTNWRQPQPQYHQATQQSQPRLQASQEQHQSQTQLQQQPMGSFQFSSPAVTTEFANLQDARTAYAALLAKVEKWADVFCGTIHTSVRSKELRTADMVRALGALVAGSGVDLEKLFTKLTLRTLLIAAFINHRVLGRLFSEQLIADRVGAEAAARLRELGQQQLDTSAREPATLRELASQQAEVLRAAFLGAAAVAWRAAEAKALAAEVCDVLHPIIPLSERGGGLREMEALVEEALRVVGALQGMPARGWHMEFSVAGAPVSLASMAVRGEVGGGGGASLLVGVAGESEGEQAAVVVLGVTPHLVSRLWTPGGVTPEELLKAEVLTHLPTFRSAFAAAQHR